MKLKVIVLLTIIFSCFIFYANSLQNPFIWDDQALVVKNTLIRSWQSWPKAFTSDLYRGAGYETNFYRPLQTLSYIYDYHFWQLNPTGYHITNILLQSAAAFLVFLLLKALTLNIPVSFACALFFAVSPIHNETVSYISGRAESLMAICILLSLLFFIASNKEKQKAPLIYFILSVSFFIPGLLAKELAIVYPLVILAYAFYFSAGRLKTKGYFIRNILPFFVISAGYALLRLTLLKFPSERPPTLTNFPWFIRLSVLPNVFFSYLKMLIFPLDLHMSRELIRRVSIFHMALSYLLLAVIIAGCVYLLKFKKERRIFSFLLAWFLIFILPQSGIIPINAFVSEHFIYLSSVSFFFALAYFLNKYLRKRLFAASVIFVVLFYGLLTAGMNFYWKEPVAFYQRIIRFSPESFQAYNNLGLEYEYRGKYEEAALNYKKALEIMPTLVSARSNLANIYFKTGKLKEAKEQYLIVEPLIPKNKLGELQNNLGCIYEAEGLLDEALDKYRLALKLDPGLNFSYYNIGKIYLIRGDKEKAAAEMLKSIPEANIPDTESGPYLDIIKNYLKVTGIKEHVVSFYNGMGVEFANKKFFEAASGCFLRAIEQAPDYVDAYFNLGLAYWNLGNKREAIFALKRALKIEPNHLKAKGLLTEIHRKK